MKYLIFTSPPRSPRLRVVQAASAGEIDGAPFEQDAYYSSDH
jgi:hypothetical protein